MERASLGFLKNARSVREMLIKRENGEKCKEGTESFFDVKYNFEREILLDERYVALYFCTCARSKRLIMIDSLVNLRSNFL